MKKFFIAIFFISILLVLQVKALDATGDYNLIGEYAKVGLFSKEYNYKFYYNKKEILINATFENLPFQRPSYNLIMTCGNKPYVGKIKEEKDQPFKPFIYAINLNSNENKIIGKIQYAGGFKGFFNIECIFDDIEIIGTFKGEGGCKLFSLKIVKKNLLML